MIDILFFLSTGEVARESITPAMCERVIAQSNAAAETGGWVGTDTPDGEILVVRISCGGHDIVLALPPSRGLCETEAGGMNAQIYKFGLGCACLGFAAGYIVRMMGWK